MASRIVPSVPLNLSVGEYYLETVAYGPECAIIFTQLKISQSSISVKEIVEMIKSIDTNKVPVEPQSKSTLFRLLGELVIGDSNLHGVYERNLSTLHNFLYGDLKILTISGPFQSGKSTLANVLASLFDNVIRNTNENINGANPDLIVVDKIDGSQYDLPLPGQTNTKCIFVLLNETPLKGVDSIHMQSIPVHLRRSFSSVDEIEELGRQVRSIVCDYGLENDL